MTRPPELEGEATGRACLMAGLADSQLYVVHVTCREAVEKIAEARSKGYNVYGETCPQYLVLDQSDMERPNFEGAKYVWSPPLREKQDQEHLWNALKNGQPQALGSDQCSFDFEGQKILAKVILRRFQTAVRLLKTALRFYFQKASKRAELPLINL